MEGTSVIDSKPQNAEPAKASSPSRSDPLALATLAGLVVILAISMVNVWNLRRLAERVAAVEAQIGPRLPEGPDPSRTYTLNIAGASSKGPDNAPVTIVEFSDFQCPFCARAVPTLKQIEDTYKGRVRIVWKHLPLAIHKAAIPAALAAEAAGNQGKFWEFHDRLFASQNKLEQEDLKQYATDLGLEMSRFNADLQNSDERKKIDTDAAEARSLGISGTPGFFINGRFVSGAQPFEIFAKIIDEELTKRNVPIPSKPSSN
jgi:protein-disulfide isomerase